MKKFFFSLFIAIVAILSFSLVSCENNQLEDVTPVLGAEHIPAQNSDDIGLLQTRRASSDWVEMWDPLTGATYYPHNVTGLNRNTFKFSVNAWGLTHEIYLKTYSPTGKIKYEKLNHSDGEFTIVKRFYESGTYYYRYFARPYNNKNILTKIHKDSKSFYVAPVPSLPFTINHNHNWKYGAVLGTVNGVDVYCNTGYKTNLDYNKEYQCVEFCNRYYDEVYGISWNYPHARDWYTNSNRIWGVDRYPNGGNTPPQPGDILCYAGGDDGYGHVAIIMEVKDSYIKVAHQNTGKSTSGPWVPIGGKLNRNGKNIAAPNGYTIQGWLRIQRD